MGAVAFRLKYGTNANRANAYGKCVSAMARVQNDAGRSTTVKRIDNAAAKCAKLNVADYGKANGLTKRKSLTACLKKTV